MPTYIILNLTLFLRVYEDLHSIVEKRVWLGMVQQIKFDLLFCPGVLHPKEEPLSMSSSVDVVLQDQVILTIR